MSLLNISITLAYLKDSNGAAHSLDSDIFQSSDPSICALQDLRSFPCNITDNRFSIKLCPLNIYDMTSPNLK